MSGQNNREFVIFGKNKPKKYEQGDDASQSNLVRVVNRENHTISRKVIHNDALTALYRLMKSGFDAYLVGGAVRDLLRGEQPKDYDLATNAHPEEIRELFPNNSRIIGRRFKIVHVYYDSHILEITTFRAAPTKKRRQWINLGSVFKSKRRSKIQFDNEFGSIQEDASRRDFTINALYYNIADFTVADYHRGMQDLSSRTIRLIGDPVERYHEDPVRMLRAVRFQVKTGFCLDTQTAQPISTCAGLLLNIPPARLFHEILKLFLEGYAVHVFAQLRQYGLFSILFPQVEACLGGVSKQFAERFIEQGAVNTDQRIVEEKPINPAFFLAVLMWQPVQNRMQQLIKRGYHRFTAIYHAMDYVMQKQQRIIAIPKRLTLTMRDIYTLQYRMESTRKQKKVRSIMGSNKFRAGFDFLLLRHQAGDVTASEHCHWWNAKVNSVVKDETGKEV